MNIQKTDLLLLNKIRFAGKNEEPQVPAQQTEQSAEAGMKALSFEGMKNLMSNPSLAQRLAADGDEETKANAPTFRNRFGKMGKVAAGAAITAATLLGAASCTDKEVIHEYPPTPVGPTNVNVSNEVNVDLSFLSSIIDYWKERDAKQDAKDAQWQEWANNMYNMFSSFYADFKVYMQDDQAFKNEVLKNQSTMINMMVSQGMSIDDATATINKILNSNLSLEAKMDLLNASVVDISKNVATLVEKAEKAEQTRDVLVALAKGTFVNTNTLVSQGKEYLKNDSIFLAYADLTADKLDKINEDINKNDQTIIKLMLHFGYTQAQIAKMSKEEIVAAIKENTKTTKEGDEKVEKAINKLDKDVEITNQEIIEAKNEILEALEKIDGHLLDLTNEFKNYAKSQKKYNFLSLVYAKQIADNTGKTAKNTNTTNVLLEKLDNSVNNITLYDNGLADKMDSLISAVQSVDINNQEGNKEIVNAIKEAKAVLVSLGVKVDGLSNEEILAELKKQTTELRAIAKDVATLKNQHAKGLINDEKYATEIISLIKGIKQDVASLSLAIGDLNQSVEIAGKNYDDALKNIQNNTYYSAYYTQKLFEAYVAESADRAALKVAMEELKPLLQNIAGTTTDIYEYLLNQGVDKADIDRVIKAISKASGDQIDASNTNTTKILNAIDKADQKLDVQIEIGNAILEKLQELKNALDKLSPVTPESVDLTKVEKTLADILDKLDGLYIPDNSAVLAEIRDYVKKLKNCECKCDNSELKVVVERIEKLIIENQNKDEGIRDNNDGLTF